VTVNVLENSAESNDVHGRAACMSQQEKLEKREKNIMAPDSLSPACDVAGSVTVNVLDYSAFSLFSCM
jgi:hypothetical protein